MSSAEVQEVSIVTLAREAIAPSAGSTQPRIKGASDRLRALLDSKRAAYLRETADPVLVASKKLSAVDLEKKKKQAEEDAKLLKEQEEEEQREKELGVKVITPGTLQDDEATTVSLQRFFDEHRPGTVHLRYSGVPGLPDHTSIVKMTLDARTLQTRTERSAWESLSSALSIQSLQRNIASDPSLELVLHDEFRKRVVAPTEVWLPPLVLLLSGSDLEGEGEQARKTERVERPGIVAAPYLIRYLIWVDKALSVQIASHMVRTVGGDNAAIKNKEAQQQLANMLKEVELLDNFCAEKMKSIREWVLNTLFRQAPEVTKPCPPSFRQLYGPWDNPEELRLYEKEMSPEEFAALPEEERNERLTRWAIFKARKGALQRLAKELHLLAAMTSDILCHSIMQKISISSSDATYWTQPALPLPKRPVSDELRPCSGINAEYGYDNLRAYLDQLRGTPALKDACKGYDLDALAAQMESEKAVICGNVPGAPKETELSSGALSLAWCYYAAVIDCIGWTAGVISAQGEKQQEQK